MPTQNDVATPALNVSWRTYFSVAAVAASFTTTIYLGLWLAVGVDPDIHTFAQRAIFLSVILAISAFAGVCIVHRMPGLLTSIILATATALFQELSINWILHVDPSDASPMRRVIFELVTISAIIMSIWQYYGIGRKARQNA